MKYIVRKYYSGFCSYVVEAEDEDTAYEKTKDFPIKKEEVINTLLKWDDCDEIEPFENFQ